jgi:hypothetical protein
MLAKRIAEKRAKRAEANSSTLRQLLLGGEKDDIADHVTAETS